jgi:heme oxygenase
MTISTAQSIQGDNASISDHASSADAHLHQGFGPRVRRLHARIGKAHHRAEGMRFSRAFLAGDVTPLQLTALLRALAPAYALLERDAPQRAQSLGSTDIPWRQLARSTALEHDLARLNAFALDSPSPAATAWLERLALLAQQAPQRLMAHVYVRYGGDLSGGQQLAVQAASVLQRHGLAPLEFWVFGSPIADLKQGLHAGFEQLQLSESEEAELLEEAETAFLMTQRLLAELAELEALR